MNVSGISLKEAMEAIEERIPYGRKVVTLLLILMILAIAVFLWKFLYGNLVFPVLAWVSSWSGTPLPIRRGTAYIADVVVALICGGIVALFGQFMMTRWTARMQRVVDDMRNIFGATDGKFSGLEMMATMSKCLNSLEERVSALENRDSSR